MDYLLISAIVSGIWKLRSIHATHLFGRPQRTYIIPSLRNHSNKYQLTQNAVEYLCSSRHIVVGAMTQWSLVETELFLEFSFPSDVIAAWYLRNDDSDFHVTLCIFVTGERYCQHPSSVWKLVCWYEPAACLRKNDDVTIPALALATRDSAFAKSLSSNIKLSTSYWLRIPTRYLCKMSTKETADCSDGKEKDNKQREVV